LTPETLAGEQIWRKANFTFAIGIKRNIHGRWLNKKETKFLEGINYSFSEKWAKVKILRKGITKDGVAS